MSHGLLWRRQVVLDDIVETTEQRVVQDLRVIRGRQDQARRLVARDHLQEAIEHASNLADVVGQSTL